MSGWLDAAHLRDRMGGDYCLRPNPEGRGGPEHASTQMPKTVALIVTEMNRVELREVLVADPGPDQVLVRNEFSVISPGTELRCIAGQQAGATFPFVPGYSAAGVVEKAGRETGFHEGDRVCAIGGGTFIDVERQWGGHAARLLIKPQSLVAVPENVSIKQAAIGKIAAIPYHGFRLAAAKPDMRCVVLGLGLIGQLSARLFAGACPTVACDLDVTRVETAKRAGIDARLIDRELQPALRELADSADIVADSTGVAGVMNTALRLLRARPWGDVEQSPPVYLVQGSYAGSMTIDYNEAFMKEAVIIVARDNGRADVEAVLQTISDGRLNVDDLLAKVVRPEEAGEVYRDLAGRSSLMTAVFDWSAH